MKNLGDAAPNGYSCTVLEDGKECAVPAVWHIWVRGTAPRKCVRACPGHRSESSVVRGEHPVGLACAVNGAFWQGDHCVLPDEDYCVLTESTEVPNES